MRKYNLKNSVVLILMTVCLLCMGVGCDSAMNADSEDVGYIRFSEAESTRGLNTGDTTDFDVQNLVWAYAAIKKDGLHTVGTSAVEVTAVTGKTEDIDGVNYVLRPVKEDFGKGLDNVVGPFSWGEWQFVLFAYEKYESNLFTNLMYRGDTVDTLVRVDPLASGATSVPVMFRLTDGRDFPSTGTLKLGNINLTVPQGMKFYSGKGVTVTFTDTASDPVSPFSGSATLSADADAGTAIPLTFSESEFEGVKEGVHVLQIEAKYDGTTVVNSASDSTFVVFITKGFETNLYGNITDLKMTVGGAGTLVSFDSPVCKVGTTEYMTLGGAVASGATDITLLRNVDNAGTIAPASDIYIECGSFYIKNMIVSSRKQVTLRDSSAGNNGLIFSGTASSDNTKVNFFAVNGSNVWVDTSYGVVKANKNTLNVYHTGSISVIEDIICANSVPNDNGYHLDAVVKDYVMVSSGFLDIGTSADIAVLKLNSSTSSSNCTIKGRPVSVVRNIDNIRDGLNGAAGAAALTSTQKTVFKKVNLHRNTMVFDSSFTTGVAKELYCIDGIGVNLPAASSILSWSIFKGWTIDDAKGISDKLVADATRFVPDKDNITLYAQMRYLPVGGRIYYIASGDNGCSYVFYKADGTAIGSYSNADGLKDAVAYTVKGFPSFDKFYVYDRTNGPTKGPLRWGCVGAVNFLIGDGTGSKTDHSIEEAADKIGVGKSRSATALSKSSASMAIVGLSGGAIGSGTLTSITVNSRYEAATQAANATSGSGNVVRNTIWSYIDYLNNGNPAGRYTTGNGCFWVAGGEYEVVSSPGGCSDWYIGSIAELGELAVWCGYFGYHSDGNTYVGTSTGKYRMNGTAVTPVSGVPSDEDKKVLYFALNNEGTTEYGIRHWWTCDEGATNVDYVTDVTKEGNLVVAVNTAYNYGYTSSVKNMDALGCIAIRSF